MTARMPARAAAPDDRTPDPGGFGFTQDAAYG